MSELIAHPAVNYCGGVLCMVLGFFETYAAGIGAMIIVLTFIFQQYHNWKMRRIAARKVN